MSKRNPSPNPHRDFIETIWFDIVWLGVLLLIFWGMGSCYSTMKPKVNHSKGRYSHVSTP